MHLTFSETQLLSKVLRMREEIVLGLFGLSSLIEHELNLALTKILRCMNLFVLNW